MPYQKTGQMIRVEQVRDLNSSYAHLGEQLAQMSKAFNQGVTPTNGQTVFTLTKAYVMGDKSLKVFVNGTLQKEGPSTDPLAAYVETDSTTVTFHEGLFDSDYVVFRVEGAGSGSTYLTDHDHIYHETPTGTIDGVNATFTISKLPIANTEQVFINGVLQEPGVDYSMTGDGTTISFLNGEVPLTGDKLKVHYDIQVG